MIDPLDPGISIAASGVLMPVKFLENEWQNTTKIIHGRSGAVRRHGHG